MRGGRVPLYAATIFLSAFLLFQVQPLVGRIVLPRFGGVASVWTTCMLFFQALLLLGYLYAHALTRRLAPRSQRVLHAVLLLAAVLALFNGLSAAAPAAAPGDPTLAVLFMLATLVGLPYFVLSATGPLLQAWFAEETQREPYRLFSLSNLGSMLALLSYPLAVEPNVALGGQRWMWSGGFVAFCLLMFALALPAVRSAVSGGRHAAASGLPARDAPSGASPPPGSPALWTLLAFCPSALLLAVTHHASDAIAPIPMLWIVFLSVYLLSFILCFESARWYRRGLYVPALFVVIGVLAYAVVTNPNLFGVRGSIVLATLALFLAAMCCHGELARRRPHPRHLTRFYLWVSVGGVLGGVFVGLLAPRLFDDYYELPIAVVLTLLSVAAVSVGAGAQGLARFARAIMLLLTLAVLAGFAFKAAQWHQRFAFQARNFYGKLALRDEQPHGFVVRTLYHGGIIHGYQSFDRRPALPTTYYTPATGVGKALRALQARGAHSVGVIGLGSGTLAAYGRAGDRYRFYDINPLVVDIARRAFTYLQDAPAQVDIVLGDGRLALQAQDDVRFDLLVVDAFSGDSIPVHLLTREAFDLYFARLRPQGIVAVHVSNRFLDLVPVVGGHATAMQKSAQVFDTESDRDSGQYGTTWVLVADSPAAFDAPALQGGKPPAPQRRVREWTDDYSSLLGVLK